MSDDRARIIVKAADDVIARMPSDVHFMMIFSLVIQAIHAALPDAETKETKAALAVKRPVSRRQRIRNEVSKCLAADAEDTAGLYIGDPTKRTFTAVKVEEAARRLALANPYETPEEFLSSETIAEAFNEIAKEKMSGTFVDKIGYASDAFVTATSKEDLVERMTDVDEMILLRFLVSTFAKGTGDSRWRGLLKKLPALVFVDEQQHISDTARVFDCLARLGVVERQSEGVMIGPESSEPLRALFDLIVKSPRFLARDEDEKR